MSSILDLFVSNALGEVESRKGRRTSKDRRKSEGKPKSETEYEISKRRLEAFHLERSVTKWKYTAVKLLVRQVTCRCCGQIQEQWPDGVFISMENKLLGKHEKNISADYTPDLYPGLRREVEYMSVEIPTCLDCFGAESETWQHPEQEQLDLFPEEKQAYSLHEPLANKKTKLNQINYEITQLEQSL